MKDLIHGILHGVLASALADGELQAEERELMRVISERFDLPEGELAAAIGDAKAGDLSHLKGKLELDDRRVVAQYAVMAAVVDGRLDSAEQKFLDELGGRLGLGADDLRSLEGLGRELAAVAKTSPIDVERLNEIVETYAG